MTSLLNKEDDNNKVIQALEKEKLFGAAVAMTPLRNDVKYRSILKEEFNAATAENCMKWGSLQINESEWDFNDADYFVNFCCENSIKVKGHALIWHNQMPSFLSNVSDGEMLLYYMESHVRKTVSHFKGKVRSWDVLNEIVSDNGKSLRDCIFTKYLGWDFISKIFKWAHEEDPDCLLFYNDYDIGHMNNKSNFTYKMIKDLLDQNIPIHGVGFQGHIHASNYDISSIDENIKRFTDLGILVNFSEVDIRVRGISDNLNDRLERQKKVYYELAQCVFKYKKFESFTLWGFTDLHSWVHGFFGKDEPLLWDTNYQKKPAYFGFLQGILNASDGAITTNNSLHIALNRANIHSFKNCVVSDAIYYVKEQAVVGFKFIGHDNNTIFVSNTINRVNITVATEANNKMIELYGYRDIDGENKLQLLCNMQLKSTNSYDNYQVQQFATSRKFKISSGHNDENGERYSIFTLIFRDNDVGNFRAIEFVEE